MATTPQGDVPGNRYLANIVSHASVASNGASASLGLFRAPQNIKLQEAYRIPAANEATHGTASTSASYRRWSITNLGSAGAGTTVMASLNQTVSQAALTGRAFSTTANNTAAAGDIIAISFASVGGDDADGTVVAAGSIQLQYELI